MTRVPLPLKVNPGTGRLTGQASIAYNDPWPCPNGAWGSGAMMGVVMHTMLGNLPGTIGWFNDPAAQASAHFGIDQQGGVHQFGPIGKGWISWAQMAGNLAWYSIEHADDGNQENPLTAEQIAASAQVVECLAGFAGFPLQVTDSPGIQGYGTHVMGGAAWGGHSCPGPGPRAGQRADILALARAIRAPAPLPPPSVPLKVTADGLDSLASLAAGYSLGELDVLWQTAARQPAGWGPLQARYAGAGDWHAPLPDGSLWWVGKAGQP